MTVDDTVIINRALQLIGTRTTITSAELVANSTNEAIQANLCYGAIRDWCLGVINWNFARKTAKLTIAKQVGAPPVTPWSTASPSPNWQYEYTLPADVLKIQYITNSDVNAKNTSFLGEPKRFVVAIDTISAVEQRVVLTNEASAVCIYTAQITTPAEWPWLFERFMVSTLAWTLSLTLEGDKDITASLKNSMMEFLSIGTQANLEEGLSFGDTTPEWIQAIGINYPFRRQDGKGPSPQPTKPNDNRS